MGRKEPLSPHLYGVLLAFITVLFNITLAAALGVNYGTLGNNLPPPAQVANFLKTRTIIDRIKIFDTNPDILRAFANTGIAITVTVGNGEIPALNQLAYARQWVVGKIAPFYPQTNIIRVLMGNEILHGGDKNIIANLLPAMKTLRNALDLAGFKDIQVSTTHTLGIMQNSEPPSMARFRPGYLRILVPMLQFLRETKSPLAINPYPYFAYTPSMGNYALFLPNPGIYDNATGITYTNMLDAMLDAIYTSMKALGYSDVEIMIAETGWSSFGDPGQQAPSLANALSYNRNLVKHLQSQKGTPLMPKGRFETYIFALFNENEKQGGAAERNFGLFQPNFTPVYDAGILRNGQQKNGQDSNLVEHEKSSILVKHDEERKTGENTPAPVIKSNLASQVRCSFLSILLGLNLILWKY